MDLMTRMIQGQASQGCTKFMVRVTRVAPPWMANVVHALEQFFFSQVPRIGGVVFALRNLHSPDLACLETLKAGDRECLIGSLHRGQVTGEGVGYGASSVPVPNSIN